MWYRTIAASAVLGAATLVGGCASNEHPEQIPLSAKMVSEGRSTVSYTASRDGTAYIYDTRDENMVWSGPVKEGQTVMVDRKNDRIMVGNQLASESLLKDGHDYQVYFDGQPRTVLERQRETTKLDSDRTNVTVESPARTSSEKVTIENPNDQKVTIERPTERSTTVERERVIEKP